MSSLKEKIKEEFEKLKAELEALVGFNKREELHAKLDATVDTLHDAVDAPATSSVAGDAVPSTQPASGDAGVSQSAVPPATDSSTASGASQPASTQS